jgi:exopolyphosphatase / guanosine-5'-triphosphate,3'-diphosphate pyrophosphatase
LTGLISVGTNSTRALVADLSSHPPKILLHRSTGTRIGEGLRERGHLDEAAMRRTLQAMDEHLQAIRELTPDVRVIATSALRRADNENVFAERVRSLTGAELEIISGEEEAACSFAGALSGMDSAAAHTFGVLDVGGGSSEYAVGTKAGPEQLVSCEIGAVRLTEAFPALGGAGEPPADDILASASAAALQALEPIRALNNAERVALVGGSATTAVSLVRGKREYFDYAQLSLAEIEYWIARLTRTPLQQRKTLPGINPQRADILLAGLLIIREFLRMAGHSTSLVSTNDVLLGYLLRHSR